MFEVQSQQPGNFSLHVQDRVRGVQLVLQASSRRAPSHPAGCVRPVSRRASSRPTPGEPLRRALRQAVARDLCVQRSASSRIRSRSCPLGAAAGWGPRRYAPRPPGPERPHSSHRVSLCGHRFSPPPPYRNSKGCWCLSDVGREGASTTPSWHHKTAPVGDRDPLYADRDLPGFNIRDYASGRRDLRHGGRKRGSCRRGGEAGAPSRIDPRRSGSGAPAGSLRARPLRSCPRAGRPHPRSDRSTPAGRAYKGGDHGRRACRPWPPPRYRRHTSPRSGRRHSVPPRS